MPPAYEVLLLNTAIPQIQAAQSGDTYVVPRDIAINATAIISANSATDALRITQTGAGNAILVEDSANPDSTPFVVTAAGDVGVGVSSPAVKLQILDSGGNSSGTIRLGGATFYGTIQHDPASTGANIYDVTSGSGGGHIFRRGGSNLMLLDASGNLGLGVTPDNWSAIVAFQVGNGASLHGFGVDEATLSTNTYYNGGYKYAASSFATQYQQQTGQHRWFTAPSGNANDPITFTQAMTLDASGRLLINATTSRGDNSPLQVTNDSANSIEVFRGETSQFGPTVLFNKSRGSTGSPTVVGSGDAVGLIAFRGYDGSSYKDAAVIQGVVDGAPGANDMPGRLVFSTTADGASTATERARITSGGDVGIGTTSVYSQLDVRGSVTTQPTVSVDNRYFIFSDWLNKTAATTHTCKITFGSQANVYLNHTVEIIFAGSSTGSTTGYGGRAVYVVNAINAIQTVTEVEDVGTGVSFAATFTGMELTITATTTANNNIIAFTARITSGISVDTARPVSMVIA